MRRFLPLAPLVFLTAACAMGPDYAGPSAEAPAPPAQFIRGGPTAASPSATADGPWWTGLGDPMLDRLVQQALAGNPDLAAAAARIREARATLRQQNAEGLPSINTSALYAKARLPGQSDSGGASSLDLYNVGFDASWELDLFGGRHRAIEAARADFQASQASLDDARVSLSAEVAQTYVDLRDRQQRVALGEQALALLDQQAALAHQRFESGTIGRGDMLEQENERDTARARLTPLRTDIDAFKDKLAVLTGATPGTLDASLDTPGALPLPPAAVAVGDPAALMQRRPDIRAAERKLAAQTARIGQSEAARFPQISFLGLIGLGGSSPGDIFDFNRITLAAAPRLSWSFLDFGRARARVDAAQAQRDEAAASYKATVLAALQDAEGALSRFQHERESLADLVRAEQRMVETAELSRQRREAGTISLTDDLAARRNMLAASQARVEAAAALTDAFIAVQKALGLGWQGLDR